MKIFVLGHRGMLGHVIERYLRAHQHEVLTSSQRYEGSPRDPLVEDVRNSGCDWVINAIGRIKQKSADPGQLYLANSQLPVHLKARLRPNQRLIQPSTDCVFSGRRGQYQITDERDADDVYGFSKILGESVAERDRCWVLRTSIIGPGLSDASGLMGWFLSQPGPVNGFLNHHWNGITTLEWAKAALELMQDQLEPVGPVTQLGVWPPVSKCELLRLIGAAWDHPIQVVPAQAPESVDRTLQPQIVRPGLDAQLPDFAAWYRKEIRAKP